MIRKVTLVCPRSDASRSTWEIFAVERRLVLVDRIEILRWALFHAEEFPEGEIERVIFDGSIDSEAYLKFLADLPVTFRGDLMLLRLDGGAWLSSIVRGDGRVIYDLRDEDVALYFQAHFDDSFMPRDLALEIPEFPLSMIA